MLQKSILIIIIIFSCLTANNNLQAMSQEKEFTNIVNNEEDSMEEDDLDIEFYSKQTLRKLQTNGDSDDNDSNDDQKFILIENGKDLNLVNPPKVTVKPLSHQGPTIHIEGYYKDNDLLFDVTEYVGVQLIEGELYKITTKVRKNGKVVKKSGAFPFPEDL